ncbi:LacI family DNA-binding transcriptional regulator [uncultured Dysosmobacter sp.]|uniref:LacI family DNA-binding transcriptional regulator n=1 Tax=uncultured Dysosmobacter sp. TaxID=2591384 RepID=UPI002604C075|nr:LacI family DNA-binding transcriptional regulator [uncultured Dysosmobacter sp.]
MVTIVDVARYASVSKSTVSLVINNSPLVKEETRQKVEDAIKTLGYVCNNNARGLRTKETKCLGLIIAIENNIVQTYDYNYETGLYSYNITNGIPVGLEGTDYGLITERYCPAEAKGVLPQAIHNGRVDGVFLVGNLFEQSFISEIKMRGLPVVVLGTDFAQVDSVNADVIQGTYVETKHLLETGHKRIAYINCPQIYKSSADRLKGFRKACDEFAESVENHWEVFCPQNTGEGGYEAVKQLWESGIRPDGIATANEPIALGVMRYLYGENIHIPDDISLVSYEASILGGYTSPALTTVNIHKEHMGEIAAQLLLKRIENPERPYETKVVAPDLVVRDSVKKRLP